MRLVTARERKTALPCPNSASVKAFSQEAGKHPGRIIGMEEAPDGSTLAYQISPRWHYVIAVTEHSKSLKWRDKVDSVPEADNMIISGGEN